MARKSLSRTTAEALGPIVVPLVTKVALPIAIESLRRGGRFDTERFYEEAKESLADGFKKSRSDREDLKEQIADRGKAFGMQTATVDGNDPEASYAALKKAMDYVRTERKPYLLEAMVSRLHGHSSASGANFVKEEVDCLTRFEQRLEEKKLLSRAQMDEMRAKYTQELLVASQKVREEPQPKPETVWDYVFADKNLVGGEK